MNGLDRRGGTKRSPRPPASGAGRRPSIAPARRAAFRALRLVAAGRHDLGDALHAARDPLPDLRDRALATDLVTGTLRWRLALDYQLQRFSARPLGRLDEEVLDALRLGAYQLLHLDRVPASAIVNDSVALVRASRVRSAAGFANAVLRRLSSERERLSWPERPASIDGDADREALIAHHSIVHSHPAWIVERWASRYGFENAERWLRFNNRVGPLTIAANRLRGTRDQLAVCLRAEGIETAPCEVAPHGLTVDAGSILTSRTFREGFCVVQDEASQIIVELVSAKPGMSVLDACASPGGKTLGIAGQIHPHGLVVATDVRPHRVDLLSATLRRCDPANVQILHVSDRGPLPFQPGRFDRVLVDAPCSGLGTIRRDPDIRWRRSPADLALFAETQLTLLQRVSPLVTQGGRLIYSTCSSEPEENEAVVAAFLAVSPEFALVPAASLNDLPAGILRQTRADGYLRTTPLDGFEAFFGAVLQRHA